LALILLAGMVLFGMSERKCFGRHFDLIIRIMARDLCHACRDNVALPAKGMLVLSSLSAHFDFLNHEGKCAPPGACPTAAKLGAGAVCASRSRHAGVPVLVNCALPVSVTAQHALPTLFRASKRSSSKRSQQVPSRALGRARRVPTRQTEQIGR
jgi:hypothetical protein